MVEVDSLTGQVYSAFYDTASDKLRFASDEGADGAMLIDDRSYGHRRGDSLVGYYSAEDTVNVVALSQTRLKVKNPAAHQQRDPDLKLERQQQKRRHRHHL